MATYGNLCGGKKLLRRPTWLPVDVLQIYNEQLRDLLLPDSTPLSERATVTIREDPKGRIILTGLHQLEITTVDELLSALNHGSTIRQTDATAINAKSSRSHAVFSLNLIQRKSQAALTSSKEKRMSMPTEAISNGESCVIVDSKLHFVDLAGSERLKNTGASGERAKEGISINGGLASLGKVISQLSSRQAGAHVSYRDSKLTRLLQDSLGGNAITYMIACVTPAEFHLSETLNTVQYAQRARAIQIKPKIQQVNDDSDKQVAIDRLRAEVAFLRQQIHSTEGADRRNGNVQERIDRPNEREVELQNQLLDVQESYTALSQRHAKAISELAKSGDTNEDAAMNHTSGESSVERLKRSRANQEQIEQMVLEYEKTIQILESNLSNTRASLANTESNLLEKETKCAYTDTMNQQLHSRIQKLMDRESNTETYLRDLESRLDGQSSGEEKNGAVIIELHKEIARIRESESNAEDYISTLEERLAEADQDMEILQREVERLEHVVDRQRSLGKLDNLLYELDHIQQHKRRKSADAEPLASAVHSTKHDYGFGRQPSLDTLKEAEETALPEESDEDLLATPEAEVDAERSFPNDDLESLTRATTSQQSMIQASPAQTKYLAEKFENITSELFDLRLEHESTLNEFDLLSAKYQECLRTLAEMQDGVDEARHAPSTNVAAVRKSSRPTSYAENIKRIEPQASKPLHSSRSLSSDLSLAEEDSSVDAADTTQSSRDVHSRDVPSPDVDKLQRMLAEHEHGMGLVTQQYAQLQAEHQRTLETVEELRAEMAKNKLHIPPSPSHMTPVVRRGTSQNVVVTDRANRALASLRTLVFEEFDGRPSKMESAELHLNAASHELQSRLERIQSLEAEMKTVKKEMDTKMTIISGLTRERNSLKGSSPVDLSMVSQMRDQLIKNELEIRSLHESRASREEELLAKIKSLKQSNDGINDASLSVAAGSRERSSKIPALQRQVSEWQSKHQAAVDSAQASEKKLLTTTAELEASMASVEAIRLQQGGNSQDASERAAAAKAMQVERERGSDLIDSLKRDIEDHQSSAARLEQQTSTLRQMISQHETELYRKDQQLSIQGDQLMRSCKEAAEYKAALEVHKQGLKSLHESHAEKVEEMKLSYAGQLGEMDDQRAELMRTHEQTIKLMNTQLEKSRSDLQSLLSRAGSVLGHATSVDMLHSHIQDLMEEKAHATEVHARLTKANAELERQLEEHRGNASPQHEPSETTADYQARIRGLAEEIANHEETIRAKEDMIRKRDAMIESISVEKKNNARIIEELEQQIETSFDHHHNRLSVMQQQGNQALVEAQARIVSLEKDLETQRGGSDVDPTSRTNTMKSAHRPQSPQADGQHRSSSMTSNLRKSASVASLPSPPPAIPLPPLPALPSLPSIAAMNSFSNSNASASPPSSRHASKELPTNANHQSQLIEDQEARIRTIEKHLNAEKQLTATLEEALVDLETQSNKLRSEMDTWKKKAWSAEEEMQTLRREKKNARESIQAVEMERDKRREAEAARAQLEERMNQLSRKKKKNALNCF
jgi:chromosome segregation ATPase